MSQIKLISMRFERIASGSEVERRGAISGAAETGSPAVA